MRFAPLLLTLLCLVPATISSPAADEPAARVAKARDGATLELDDGRVVRLAGLLAPRPDEPFFEPARAGLETLVAGWIVIGGPVRHDRWGRVVAQAADRTGGWIQ
ncbi:MAG: hypothetical protein HQL38_13855, partial [Alphaproteobacteria bacterium]|nr:hypothetical protein [Alphaproteobacteria bacterium]